jgi:hypothetical protein
MAQFKLYIDTESGELVRGASSTTLANLPRFFQGDTISFRIYLLERTASFPAGSSPYSIINNADLSLRVGIGPKNGTAGSTLYTSQFTWEKDPTNSFFFADLALNTSGINGLISGGESGTAWFEVEYIEDSLPTTVFQRQITIEAEVLESTALIVPPGETPLSAETANATYLQRDNNGFYLSNATTGHKVFVYLDENDQVQFSPVEV